MFFVAPRNFVAILIVKKEMRELYKFYESLWPNSRVARPVRLSAVRNALSAFLVKVRPARAKRTCGALRCALPERTERAFCQGALRTCAPHVRSSKVRLAPHVRCVLVRFSLRMKGIFKKESFAENGQNYFSFILATASQCILQG